MVATAPLGRLDTEEAPHLIDLANVSLIIRSPNNLSSEAHDHVLMFVTCAVRVIYIVRKIRDGSWPVPSLNHIHLDEYDFLQEPRFLMHKHKDLLPEVFSVVASDTVTGEEFHFYAHTAPSEPLDDSRGKFLWLMRDLANSRALNVRCIEILFGYGTNGAQLMLRDLVAYNPMRWQ